MSVTIHYLKTKDNPFGLGKTNFEYQTLPFIYHLYLGTELTFKPSVVLLLVPPSSGSVFFLVVFDLVLYLF